MSARPSSGRGVAVILDDDGDDGRLPIQLQMEISYEFRIHDGEDD
jgi:hypothetical protein